MVTEMDVRLGVFSDFRQHYDHQFDAHYPEMGKPLTHTLLRASRNDLTRRDQFHYLAWCGFHVPLAGELWTMPPIVDRVVVYVDLYAHASEGKGLGGRFETLIRMGGQQFVSAYIPSGLVGASYRVLGVGSYRLLLHYHSRVSWMSNVDPRVQLLEAYHPSRLPFDTGWSAEPLGRWPEMPLWAIDFVQDAESGTMVAVDMNTAPGIPLSAYEPLGGPTGIVTLLRDWFAIQEDRRGVYQATRAGKPMIHRLGCLQCWRRLHHRLTADVQTTTLRLAAEHLAYRELEAPARPGYRAATDASVRFTSAILHDVHEVQGGILR